ncbi:hypothetical protein VNO77_27057 [Canavalia gladiata]|uniref:MCM OB domain-containing protein n=1 Tax=Canavalia gladiata TaxID=3824 RepID=A0AAN9KTC2_CANGL
MQETSKEISASSLPRSLDVILCDEIVEQTRVGDTVIFTGTVVVIPNIFSLASLGEKSKCRQEASHHKGSTTGNKGVKGLKALEVRRPILLSNFYRHLCSDFCAKSQFHKYTSGIVPRSMYTSRKPSSITLHLVACTSCWRLRKGQFHNAWAHILVIAHSGRVSLQENTKGLLRNMLSFNKSFRGAIAWEPTDIVVPILVNLVEITTVGEPTKVLPGTMILAGLISLVSGECNVDI